MLPGEHEVVDHASLQGTRSSNQCKADQTIESNAIGCLRMFEKGIPRSILTDV